MKYRTLSVVDAEKFWEMMNQLDHETKYMLYEPGERTKDLAKIESAVSYTHLANTPWVSSHARSQVYPHSSNKMRMSSGIASVGWVSLI